MRLFLFALPVSVPVPLPYWQKDRTSCLSAKAPNNHFKMHFVTFVGTSIVLYNVGTATHLSTGSGKW